MVRCVRDGGQWSEGGRILFDPLTSTSSCSLQSNREICVCCADKNIWTINLSMNLEAAEKSIKRLMEESRRGDKKRRDETRYDKTRWEGPMLTQKTTTGRQHKTRRRHVNLTTKHQPRKDKARQQNRTGKERREIRTIGKWKEMMAITVFELRLNNDQWNCS